LATGCFDEKIVLAFLDGTLPGATRAQAEAHLASCGSCADLLTWAAADIAHASRAPGHEGQPFVGQLAPGTRVDRYQILGPIGRGGMGEVYAAYHPDLDRRIALKIVYESSAGSAERRARLLREARTIARLSHPNVIAVYDAGTFGERVYIAMEFVDGDTLDDWRRTAARSWREILDVFVATGRGLAAAHAAGIVHRDFKPQNVMVGKDGSVRVMDFGLARLLREDLLDTGSFEREVRDAVASDDQTATHATIRTGDGALLGTPAYMAPEQWRGEPSDARADQFSFCVALHEALYGARPALAHLRGESAKTGSGATRRAGTPAWLRGVVDRGLSADKNKRYDSIDQLLSALARGRTRGQRRFAGLAVGVTITLLAVGAWRISHPRRFNCRPTADRIAAAWSPDGFDQRRQSIQAAVLGSGHPQATTIWQQISSGLDAYMGRWRDMYQETCEATHIRGEQSAEVLDLRMRCLNENLDDVRALATALATTDRASVPNGITAVADLTPVSRCADVRFLQSAVPLPRDEKTLRAVQTLQSSFREIQALDDLGLFKTGLERATALRPAVESTGYKPLLADLLYLDGDTRWQLDDIEKASKDFEESLALAIETKYDLVAAKSSAALVGIVGLQGQYKESDLWWSLANAFLEHFGDKENRVRAWAIQNHGVVLFHRGDFEGARESFQRAIVLKEEVLGPNHPDVERSLSSLGLALKNLGRLDEALDVENRAIEILTPNSDLRMASLTNRGEILFELKRYREAEISLNDALQVISSTSGASSTLAAHPLTALGSVKLATGDLTAAVAYLEQALRIREAKETDEMLVAETRFGLARALWESGGDRVRSISLARAARETYERNNRSRQLNAADGWLAVHAVRAGQYAGRKSKEL
jgi:eukaryotic-like serine/threonine-protein kinase